MLAISQLLDVQATNLPESVPLILFREVLASHIETTRQLIRADRVLRKADRARDNVRAADFAHERKHRQIEKWDRAHAEYKHA